MFGMSMEEEQISPGGPPDGDDAVESGQESGSSDSEDFKENECPACEQPFGSQDKDRLWALQSSTFFILLLIHMLHIQTRISS